MYSVASYWSVNQKCMGSDRKQNRLDRVISPQTHLFPPKIKLIATNPANTQRRYNVTATSRHCRDVVTPLFLRCVFAE